MDNRVELMLVEAGRSIEWPEPSATFSQRVVTRIQAEPVVKVPFLRRLAPALSLVLVLVAAVITFSPASRDAIADFIGIGGVRIQQVPRGDLPTVRPGATLDLGEAVPLEAARAAVPFPVLVPTAHGTPDQVYLERAYPADMVSLVYSGEAHSSVDEVEILITQFEGELLRDDGLLKKMSSGGTLVQRVEVNGTEGYWLTGEPHFFYYRTEGMVRDEIVRLVENVLLWVEDGVTIRIETDRSLDHALEVAASLR